MATLARIPFSQSDEAIIGGLNTWMLVAAIVHFIGAAFFLTCGCFGVFGMGVMISMNPIAGILGVVQMLLMLGLGVVLVVEGIAIVRARGSFASVVTTDQNDQELLSAAFGQMKMFFALELAWFGVLLLLTILGLVLAIVAPELGTGGFPGMNQGGGNPFGGGGYGGGGSW